MRKTVNRIIVIISIVASVVVIGITSSKLGLMDSLYKEQISELF